MNILFLCTHNACRSILAEAIFRHVAAELEIKAQIYSAGSAPRGQVHPLTLQYLTDWQMNTTGLFSKSWDDLANLTPDVVITVCNQAAGETCPGWFGKAVKAHWSLPDPTRAGLSEPQQQQEFVALFQALQLRANALFQMTSHADSAALAAIAERFPVKVADVANHQAKE